jgi:hypothetical protein
VQDQEAGLQKEVKLQDVNGIVNMKNMDNKNKNMDLDGSQVLSPKQKRIAAMAPPFNKITGADFKMLRNKNKK